MLRPVLLFMHDEDLASLGHSLESYHSLAVECGFRVFVGCWKDLKPSRQGMWIRTGYEILPCGQKRVLSREEAIQPHAIVHRKLVWGLSDLLLEQLKQEYRGVLLSYHSYWKFIGQKWNMESCFRAAERKGLRVERPATYLVPRRRIFEELKHIGRAVPLIFKPVNGSQCDGILLSTPENFACVARQIGESTGAEYVVQEFVVNTVLCRGRKFDLRVYTLVDSFRPLRFRVYREGVGRIAAEEFDPLRPVEGLGALTGYSYRKRNGRTPQDLSISALLCHLGRDGWDVANFWGQVETLLQGVFECFARTAIAREEDLSGRFYLAGVDLVMVPNGSSFQVLFLETNYVPQLSHWGAQVDACLEHTHRSWLTDVRNLCID